MQPRAGRHLICSLMGEEYAQLVASDWLVHDLHAEPGGFGRNESRLQDQPEGLRVLDLGA